MGKDVSRFRGIALWDYLFLSLLYIFLIIFIVIMEKEEQNAMDYVWLSFALICCLFVLFYSRERTLRIKTQKVASIMFIDGWIKTGNDAGEEFFFGIKKTRDVSDITKREEDALGKFFIAMNNKYAEMKAEGGKNDETYAKD